MTISPGDPDAGVIESIRAGDRQAFDQLFQRYQRRVFHLAMRFTREPAEAEEVSQEVFLIVSRKLEQFEGASSFSTWLYKITVNASLMRLREHDHVDLVPLDVMDPETISEDLEAPGAPDQRITTEQSLALIEKAMERMDPDLKTVFILRDVENFSTEDVAEILELSVAAVKTRLHRARQFLRSRLKGLFLDTIKA